jgi:hypothetical protein
MTCLNGVAVAAVVILSLVSISNCQGLDGIKNQLNNAMGGAPECIAKLPQCSSNKPADQERESSQAKFCCHSAAYTRCVENLISSTCPGTALDRVVSAVETGRAGTLCEGYTFWTPVCS